MRLRTILLLAFLVHAAALRAAPSLEEQVLAHLQSLPESRVKVMLQEAMSYLGVPYRWGGDNPKADGGFDCEGLAYSLYHEAGLEFPYPRFTTISMTDRPRGPNIAKVWWTAFAPEFAQTMVDCRGGPFRDGDVLVYHVMSGGTVTERTGHAVLVMDAAKGYAISAAHSGVRLHSLGDFSSYDGKSLSACWRAASAALPPLQKRAVKWTLIAPAGRHDGSYKDAYPLSNPLDVTLSAEGPEVGSWRFTAAARVLSLIGAVEPEVTELASTPGKRRWHLHHDFKKLDLPVDPGEIIPTPRRRIVARLFDAAGFIASETVFYVEFHPYWH